MLHYGPTLNFILIWNYSYTRCMFVNVFLKFQAILCQMAKPKTTETLVRQTSIQDFFESKRPVEDQLDWATKCLRATL